MNCSDWKRVLSAVLTLALALSTQLGPVAKAQNMTPGDKGVIEKAIGPEGGYVGKILYQDTSDRIFGS